MLMDSNKSIFSCSTTVFVHEGPRQSMPIRTDLCHSRVNENSRSDPLGRGCSIPRPLGPGVRFGGHLNVLCASDEPDICVNEVRHLAHRYPWVYSCTTCREYTNDSYRTVRAAVR